MEKELPKLDIATDFEVGTGIPESILNLYTNFPCRLKAAVFVLCTNGRIEGMVNLKKCSLKKNDFIVLTPGSILQLQKIQDHPQFYVLLFSSFFLESTNIPKSIMDFLYATKYIPIINLSDEYTSIYEDAFKLLIRLYEVNEKQNPEILRNLLFSILYRTKDFYIQQYNRNQERPENRNEQICEDFGHLVIQHYTHERNISFYSKKLGITSTHLSNTVKQVTGKTVMQIISAMVINDAKAQLKSTTLPINEIAESLNFANVSFFGKYFKRYVGMGPQAYRNS